MIPIPAIDLKEGQCVRLLRGEMSRETVYSRDPVAMARRWETEGANRLHVVDLDGAIQGIPVHAELIREMAAAVSIPLEVGGGIRTHAAMKSYLEAGVATVIVGTSAFQSPGFLEEAARQFPGRFAVALDTRDGKIVVKGWVDAIPEGIEKWMDRLNQLPLFAVIHTDVGRDGTQEGPNTIALRTVLMKSRSPVIASGGVGGLEDLEKLRSLESEVGKSFYGVIIGRALYEAAFTLQEAMRLLGDSSC